MSDMDLGNADGEMIKDVLAMTGAIDSEEFAKFEAEYSLLDSGFSTGSNNNSSSAAPSRAVGGGRGSSSGASGQTASSLWGNSGSDSNHHGLPSPIGTVNGHARRGLDGFDGHGSNGKHIFFHLWLFFSASIFFTKQLLTRLISFNRLVRFQGRRVGV